FNPVLGRSEENMTLLLDLIERAAREGAQLVVAPEMAPCGYCFFDREEIAPYVEPVPGPMTLRLEDVAKRYGCWIVCGLAEVDPDTELYYNTAVLVGPQGLIGKYRKVHFFASDAKWGIEGDLGFPVWETPIGRIGIEICMDATYPESGRLLAMQGADVICFPTNWVGDDCPNGRWISQAFENGVYWVAANRSDVERGMQFTAGSCIVEPDGSLQAVAGEGEEVLFGEIDLERTAQRRYEESGSEDKLADRRPELYREMLRNTYTWSPPYFQTLYGVPGLPEPRRDRVGALQVLPVRGNRQRNIDNIQQLLGDERLDLAVLPELALSGFPDSRAEAGEWCDWDGDVAILRALAEERKTLIATSLIERREDTLFNMAVLVGPDGVLLATRKSHLTRDDRPWASPGFEPPRTVDTPLGRIGLLAGYDALFWEMERVLATLGADLICIPAALRWPRPVPLWGNQAWIHWRWKAWESCVALAVANYPGPEYAGGSGIWMPHVRENRSQEWVSGREGDALAIGEVDTGSKYIREKRGLSWRRLQWYTPLVLRPESLRAEGLRDDRYTAVRADRAHEHADTLRGRGTE
ncbi:MAG: nitrilase/cyanide hydratase and apolipoprotein N-acyltransferase, partial [Chloroflexota bacterium]|nr:nitrilase/cyanide hydratase and apolipoprotein N-acyltransferase [Chloroflexota bacterium]